MNLASARARYLSVIGAILPTLTLVACKEPNGATPDSVATSTPQTSNGGPPIGMSLPSCPNGAFCIAEGDKHLGKEAAAAPYGKCSTSATLPEDEPDTGLANARSVSFSPENTKTARTKTPSACCYTWVIPCPGGRAFRDATGTPSVARTIPRADWSTLIGGLSVAGLSTDERAAAAAHWTREAAFEHASIASFAQLTLDLLGVGAPPDLLAAAQCASLDEIEHARVAFALAAAYGAEPVGPAPLAASPGRCRTLADIARLTFVDACIGESVAAASLAEDARRTNDPVLCSLLAGMAEDEQRHAELAWRIVAWALREGGSDVRAALAAVHADAIDELVVLTNDRGASIQHALRATVLREIVLPCSVALLSTSSSETVLGSASRTHVA